MVAVVVGRFAWDVLGSAPENWYHTTLRPLIEPWWMGSVYTPVADWCSRFVDSSVDNRISMMSSLLSPVASLVVFFATALAVLVATVLLLSVVWFVWVQGGFRPAFKTVGNGFRNLGKSIYTTVHTDVGNAKSWLKGMYGSAQKGETVH